MRAWPPLSSLFQSLRYLSRAAASTLPPLDQPQPAGLPPVTLFSHPRASTQTIAPFRLRRHADYQRVYAVGRKQFSSSMAFFLRLRTPADLPPVEGPRIGLTVPRALGGAVIRNRIKRRMREAVRLHLHLLHRAPAPHLDLVLHPRKTVAEMDFALLTAEVAKVLAQAAVLATRPALPPLPPGPKRKAAAR